MDFIVVKSSKQTKEDYVSIYARIRNSNHNRKYAVGFCIRQSEWETYKNHKYHVDTVIKSLNITYGVFANVLEQIKQELEEKFDPSTASQNIKLIKESFTKASLPSNVDKMHSNKHLLTDFMQQYHDDHVKGIRLKFGSQTKLKKSSLRSLLSCMKSIKEFEKYVDKKITLDEIDSNFRNSYVSWLTEQGYQLLSIRGKLSVIRTCMKAALTEHFTNNDRFLYNGFVPQKNPIDHVYLTPQQISEMLDFNISTRKELIARVNEASFENDKRKEELINFITDRQAEIIRSSRDIFIVGCLTGQRSSDYMRINKNMITTINQTRFIKLIQEKTGKTVYIPEDYRVKDILRRYKGTLPKVPQHKLNKHIKTIAELMGWTDKPCFDKNRIGRKSGPRFCDMICSHTARRSFATNSYIAGVPLKSIMAITGHSSEESLRNYLHLSIKDNAILAAMGIQKILDL